jgi:hypothetical protein
MGAGIVYQIILTSCFLCCVGSAALRAEDPPAAPKTLAQLEQEYKTLLDAKKQDASYKILGQIWAADPARIPEALPALMIRFGNMKAGELYMRDVLTPGAKHCVPELMKMLQSEEREKIYPATAGLRIILNDARPALEELLVAGTTPQRFVVIRILGSDRQPMAVESTATKLKTVLQDRAPELQVEAALALLDLKVDDARIAKVLEQNFPKFGERIMQEALLDSDASEALRGVLTLAMNQKENRNWRVGSALQLASLDKKLSVPVQAAIIEGLFKQQSDSYRLAEKCAAALSRLSYNSKDSILALTRLCHDGSTSLELAAAGAATLIQLDPEHAPAYVPYLLTIVTRPRYRLEKAKYLAVIGRLGKAGRGAEATLRDILPREGGTCDLLMAIVLLNIDPEHPEQANDFLRAALNGKQKAGGVGLNPYKDAQLNCAPLLADLQAALESDDSDRRYVACLLLELGGQSALPVLPVLEKKLGAVEKVEQESLRSVINKLKAAKP